MTTVLGASLYCKKIGKYYLCSVQLELIWKYYHWGLTKYTVICDECKDGFIFQCRCAKERFYNSLTEEQVSEWLESRRTEK